MSELLQKLSPHRTMYLRGFDRRGAAAAMHHASPNGFQLSGVFRDMADFCVLVLFDADDYFGHWQTTKYLPSFDFSGMVLSYNVTSAGTQSIDSPAYQWIPWRSLSYVKADGTRGSIDLAPYATYVSGSHAAASAQFTVSGTPRPYDRVTLWYQNIAFDFIVTLPAGNVNAAEYDFFAGGAGTVHSVTINGVTYSHTEGPGESSADAAAGLLAAITSTDVNAAIGSVPYSIRLTPAPADSAISCSASDGNGPATLYRVSTHVIAAGIAAQVNGFSWTGFSLPLSATVAGSVITVLTRQGVDGNSITLYSFSKNANTTISPAVAPLTGGASDATWNVAIDFTALGIDQLRQCWLTIAPQLTSGGAYADTEWTYTVSSWSVWDPNGKRPLKIAGPGSVRVGNRDTWANYSGDSWTEEASNQPGGTGWFFRGFAQRASTPGDSVTVRYSCQHAHQLYLGTSVYSDRGQVLVSVDGAAALTVDCYLDELQPVVTRRRVPSGTAIPAGDHVVTITLDTTHNTASSGSYFYFDFLEAVVAGDIEDPDATHPALMPATDFDTDHCYKLPPQRLVWMLDKLGFRGQMDHYLGVFWWNQRKRIGGSFATVALTFGGTWADGDTAFLTVSGASIGKSVFYADTPSTIAAHFAYFINETFTGIRASAAGAVLTIQCRTPEFAFTFSTSQVSTAGTMTTTGELDNGIEGDWFIDDTVRPVINRAVTDWHGDLWAEVQARGWKATAAFSMELVNPPEATGAVYAQRFADGTAVATDTGFSSLKSTQCTFNATFRTYQQEAYKEMAGLMTTAGLTAWLQFGEFLWWFFDWYASGGFRVDAGMAFYDADTTAAATAALGRPLATFAHTTSDPAVNGYADADFLRGLIHAHTSAIATYVKATYPGAKFEALWPYDVNYPELTAVAGLGGRLNRYVNLPSQWETKAGSALDRFKTEALAFGATERNLDQASQAAQFARTAQLDWDLADTAYLIPIFNGGCPWVREHAQTIAARTPAINLWAFDHFCLLSWPLPLPLGGTSWATI